MNVVTLSALIEIKLERLLPIFNELVEELRWNLFPTDEEHIQLLDVPIPIPILYRSTGNLTSEILEQHGIDKISSQAIRLNSHNAAYINKLEKKLPFTKNLLTAFAKPDNWIQNKVSDDRPQLILINNRDFVELHLSCKRSINYYHVLSSVFSNKVFLSLIYLVLKERLEEKLFVKFSHFDISEKASDENVVNQVVDKAKDLFGSFFSQKKEAEVSKEVEVPIALYQYCQRLKGLIAEAEIDTCFSKLQTLFSKVKSHLQNGFTVLQAHFIQMNEKMNKGIITLEQERLETNRINHRLLFLIDNLDDDQEIIQYFVLNKVE